MNNEKFMSIVAHYEACLEEHGDTHLGVDWPDKKDAEKRYRVMLDVIKPIGSGIIELLDFGCGASHLYQYILQNRMENIAYSGLDISDKYVQLSRNKYPSTTYYCMNILEEGTDIPNFDYIIMNGVFTEKRDLSFDEMFAYFKRVVHYLFSKTKIGIAFNVMSSHVDWERDDLFHLPLDILASFLTNKVRLCEERTTI
jgi:SAM-dependent methyltransferase